jgi:hypothetical protein
VGGNRARHGAPDQRFHLSATRTRQYIPAFLTIALAGSAIALAGVASGTRATGPPGHPGLAVVQGLRTGSAITAGPSLPAGQRRGRTGSAITIALAARAAPALPGHRLPPQRRTPQQLARALLGHRFHWKAWQFKYLNRLWSAESGWNRYATNPDSGAYGIPQAVPGDKMSSAGPGWRWNVRTQIVWGMRYIKACYRTPYWAWLHHYEDGWY